MGKFRQILGLQPSLLADEPLGDYSADVAPVSREVAGVSVDRALGLPAVFRSVQITAGMAAQLTIDSYRGSKRLDPAPALVAQPDTWRPLSSWIERFVISLATEGNTFLRKHRYPDGSIASLEVLNPHLVTITRTKNGVKAYRYIHDGKAINLTSDEVEHVWFMELPGRTRGLSPIGACRAALSGILDVRDYADGWFGATDVPSGILTTDQPLDNVQAAEYKRRWLNPWAEDDPDKRTGPTVRVLGKGLSYQAIPLNPEDAQWVESQKLGVLDIARIFGMPADYLHVGVDGSSLTYQNLEAVHAQFLRLTLFPLYLRKIEAALTSVLPRGQVARVNTSALLRPDAKTRAEIDRIYLDAGVIAPIEVRTREGWDGPAPAKPAPAPKSPGVPA